MSSWRHERRTAGTVGLKTGLFQAVADARDGISDHDLAARLDSNPEYVQLWCRSAYAYEFLEWDEASGYRLTTEMRALLLDTTDSLYMGGRMQFFAAPGSRPPGSVTERATD